MKKHRSTEAVNAAILAGMVGAPRKVVTFLPSGF
jgi:hypothetical protein